MGVIRKINGCLVDALIIASGLMALAILLTGCTIARIPVECGTIKPFSLEWQHQLADEIKLLPETDPVVQAVTELKRTRCEALSCQKGYDVCKPTP